MNHDLSPEAVARRLDRLRTIYVPETETDARRRLAQPSSDRPVAEAGRLGVGVGVECGLPETRTGPPAAAPALVRVGFPGDVIGNARRPRMRRGLPPRKAGRGEVEAPPEEVDRARLPQEIVSELLGHAIGLRESVPEPSRPRRVVRGVRSVLDERDRLRNLDRNRPDLDLDLEIGQRVHGLPVEVGDRHRAERQIAARSVARHDSVAMVEEVEIHLERAVVVGDGAGREPAAGQIEGDVPPVVDGRRLGEPHLAHHLAPHVERCVGVEPGLEGQLRPGLVVA